MIGNNSCLKLDAEFESYPSVTMICCADGRVQNSLCTTLVVPMHKWMTELMVDSSL